MRMKLSSWLRDVIRKPKRAIQSQHPRGQSEYPVTLMSHKLASYDGRITLVLDEESRNAYGHLGWDKIPGVNLEVHVLPGTHITYIRDHNVSAAAKLRELLARATSG
jgi:hypothetical protein